MKETAGETMPDARSTSSDRTLSVLICPNAFKGSLTAEEAARAIAEGLMRSAREQAWAHVRLDTTLLPLADGGDGLLETLIQATDGELFRATVQDPLGRPIVARWGRLGGARSDTAVIEMAEASGLRLLRPQERDPSVSSTYGTGELMLRATDAGYRKLLVGIGGSATNDGGAGMAAALGVQFLDAAGRPLPPGGLALRHLAAIRAEGWRLPPDTEVTVACDVDNPLCGPEGASAVYGPQKGAPLEMIQPLDDALARYAAVIQEQIGVDVDGQPGAGAAGGLGGGLMAFCRAALRHGTELILDALDFDGKLSACTLVVTGEGRLDTQTARGKLIAGVARRARNARKPVVALTGSIEESAEPMLRALGVTAVLVILDGPQTLEQAMQDAYRLIARSGARLGDFLGLALLTGAVGFDRDIT